MQHQTAVGRQPLKRLNSWWPSSPFLRLGARFATLRRGCTLCREPPCRSTRCGRIAGGHSASAAAPVAAVRQRASDSVATAERRRIINIVIIMIIVVISTI